MAHLTVRLLQTWPKQNRRTGAVAWARRNDETTFTLMDDEGVEFYMTAVEGTHFRVIPPRPRTSKTTKTPVSYAPAPLNGQNG